MNLKTRQAPCSTGSQYILTHSKPCFCCHLICTHMTGQFNQEIITPYKYESNLMNSKNLGPRNQASHLFNMISIYCNSFWTLLQRSFNLYSWLVAIINQSYCIPSYNQALLDYLMEIHKQWGNFFPVSIFAKGNSFQK